MKTKISTTISTKTTDAIIIDAKPKDEAFLFNQSFFKERLSPYIWLRPPFPVVLLKFTIGSVKGVLVVTVKEEDVDPETVQSKVGVLTVL